MSFDEEHLDEHGECAHEIHKLQKELAAANANGRGLAQAYLEDTKGLREQIAILEQRLAEASSSSAEWFKNWNALDIEQASLRKQLVEAKEALVKAEDALVDKRKMDLAWAQFITSTNHPVIEMLTGRLAEVVAERNAYKRLYELRGKALLHPCLKCGYVQGVVATDGQDKGER